MQIYLITNTINGKQYVGQTVQTLEARWKLHRHNEKCIALHRAIKKYGAEAFSLAVLETCSTIEQLNEAERAWIEKLNTRVPNGYNIREGGGNGPHSEESKAKMREIQSNRSQEWKDNMRAGYVRRSQDEAWKGALSKAAKKRTPTKKQLDALAAGRLKDRKGSPGESNPNSKVTTEQVVEIRRLYDTGDFSQQQLADRFGLTQIGVSAIIRRKTWKHI